jgi:hypothetical protein
VIGFAEWVARCTGCELMGVYHPPESGVFPVEHTVDGTPCGLFKNDPLELPPGVKPADIIEAGTIALRDEDPPPCSLVDTDSHAIATGVANKKPSYGVCGAVFEAMEEEAVGAHNGSEGEEAEDISSTGGLSVLDDVFSEDDKLGDGQEGEERGDFCDFFRDDFIHQEEGIDGEEDCEDGLLSGADGESCDYSIGSDEMEEGDEQSSDDDIRILFE